MPYSHGARFEDFSLTSYNGSNATNDGATAYSPYGFSGPVLLAFLNVNAAAASAGPWFASLKALKDDAAISGAFQLFIVAFNYNNTTSNYLSVNDGMVSGAFPTGVINSDFIGIPIVKDNGTGSGTDYGKYSKEHLAALGGTPPAARVCWFYLCDPAGLICDRWHSGASHAGISFIHLTPRPYASDFLGSDPVNVTAYVKARILNLAADLKVVGNGIGADPTAGSIINSASKVKRIILSRPIAATITTPTSVPLTTSFFPLTGGGVDDVADPAYPLVDGAVYNAVENYIDLTYASGGLTDSGPTDEVTLVLDPAGILDTSSNPIKDGDNRVAFVAHVSAPKLLSPAPSSTVHVNASQYDAAHLVQTVSLVFDEAARKTGSMGTFLDSADILVTGVSGFTTNPAIGVVSTADGLTYSVPITLQAPPASGAFTLRVSGVCDQYGNAWTAPVDIPFVVDIAAPPVSITAPAAGKRVNGDRALSLGVTDCVFSPPASAPRVTIDSYTHPCFLASGPNPVLLPFKDHADWASIPEDGPFTVYLHGQDAAGNPGDASRSFVKDTTGPYLTDWSLEPANAYVDLTFSEPVHAANGTDPVAKDSFDLGFSQNGGSATGAAIGSLSDTSGAALTGGATAVRVNIAYTGTPNGLESLCVSVKFPARVIDEAGNPASGTIATPVLALHSSITGRDAVLALDFSSTMNSSVTINAGTASEVTGSRISFLDQAVQAFLKVWKADCALEGYTDDRVEIIAFGNDLTVRQPLDLLSGVSETIINGSSGSGCTAMGSALAKALVDLDYRNTSTTRKRCAVVITDGMQNVNPMVYYPDGSSADPRLLIDVIDTAQLPPSGFFCTHTTATLPGSAADRPYVVRDGTANKVPIHTIGIGDESGFEQLLKDISGLTYDPATFDPATYASQSQGLHFAADDLWPNLETALANILVQLFKGSSIQMAAAARGTAKAGTTRKLASFELSASASSLMTLVSWPADARLRLRLSKDGVAVKEKTVGPGTRSHVLAVKLPTRVAVFAKDKATGLGSMRIPRRLFGKKPAAATAAGAAGAAGAVEAGGRRPRWVVIPAKGRWTVEVECISSSVAELPLSCIAFIDDRILDLDLQLPSVVKASRRPLRIEVRVMDRGRPVSQGVRCDLTALAPAEAPANVLSRFSGKMDWGRLPKACGDVSALKTAVDRLVAHKPAAAALRATKAMKVGFTPVPGSPGRYVATIPDCRTAGTYRLSFELALVLPDGSTATRVLERSLTIVPDLLEVKPEVNAVFDDRLQKLLVLVSAVDACGNVIGPQFADRVTAKPGWGQEAMVHGLVDGGFVVQVSCTAAQFAKEGLAIHLGGKPLFSGQLRDVKPIPKPRLEILRRRIADGWLG